MLAYQNGYWVGTLAAALLTFSAASLKAQINAAPESDQPAASGSAATTTAPGLGTGVQTPPGMGTGVQSAVGSGTGVQSAAGVGIGIQSAPGVGTGLQNSVGLEGRTFQQAASGTATRFNNTSMFGNPAPFGSVNPYSNQIPLGSQPQFNNPVGTPGMFGYTNSAGTFQPQYTQMFGAPLGNTNGAGPYSAAGIGPASAGPVIATGANFGTGPQFQNGSEYRPLAVNPYGPLNSTAGYNGAYSPYPYSQGYTAYGYPSSGFTAYENGAVTTAPGLTNSGYWQYPTSGYSGRAVLYGYVGANAPAIGARATGWGWR